VRRTKATEAASHGGTTAAADTLRRADRYRAIYRDWRAGIDISTIAATQKITPRRVQQIVDQLRAKSIDAMEIGNPLLAKKLMEEMLVQMISSVTEAALMMREAQAKGNLPTALAAMKHRDEARLRLIETMKEVGLVPRNLEWLVVQLSGIALADAAIEVLDRHEVPLVVQQEIAEAMGFRTVRSKDRLELDMSPEAYREQLLERQFDKDP